MLDPDISAADALRLLSDPDDDPTGLNRRRFLQMIGWGVGGGALLGTLGAGVAPGLLPWELREAWAADPIGPTDGVLVLLGMNGGNDGLNTVVPYNNGLYYQQRPNVAIAASDVLPIDGSVGLNNRLGYVKWLYDRGEVAIVQGVGYPNPDLSHFTSMAIWMQGKAGTGASSNGWIGRWLDGLGGNSLFGAASIGQGLPLHLIGQVRRGISIPQWGIDFGGGSDPHDLRMYNAVRQFAAQPAGRGLWHDQLAGTAKGLIDLGQEVGPVFARSLSGSSIVKKMTVAARLINADLGLRVIDTSYDGFDNHSGEPGDHGDRMVDLNAAVQAFYGTLDDRFRSRVTIMTYSEFGRTSFSNDSQGTDHGTANDHFVIGAGVQGGLYGAQPSLAGLQEWDRLPFNVDFRSLYTSVLDGWMGGGASTVLGGTFPDLHLFKATPGQGVATGGVPPSVVGDFVPLVPARLYDSRVGTGGRVVSLGAGTVGEVQVLGAGGVPTTGVTSVALNVTSVQGTATTSFTVWPTGEAKPVVANVSAKATFTVPNLVIVKVGEGGRVNVANDLGASHCVVDVVGYFRQQAASRLTPITPYRVLDNRIGTGGFTGRLGPRSSIDVRVTGLGGVPADATAVIANVTAVFATASGYATVWPTGTSRPLASNLNFEVGQTIPNVVIAKVGAGGKISLYNENGSPFFVIDVLGYMSPTSPGRYFPLPAARVFASQSGSSGPGPKGTMGAASTRTITVGGVGGVPASGVSAVALNITAIGGTKDTFITAWPNGEARPLASNLNPAAGFDVSNLAIVKLGSGGQVQVYNENGSVNLVVDVVGYFTS